MSCRKPGDVVVIERRGGFPSERLKLLNVPRYENDRCKSKPIRHQLPSEMTPALARVLGYLVAEGSVGDVIQFGNASINVMEDFEMSFHEAFPDYNRDVEDERATGAHVSTSTTREMSFFNICRKDVVHFLRGIGLTQSAARDKQVPWSIMQADRDSVVAFVSAYFEGDGSARTDEASVGSASVELLRQIQILLLQFGIISRRNVYESSHCTLNDKTYGEYSTLHVYAKEYDHFCDVIGFRSPNKKAYAAMRRTERRSKTDKISYVQDVAAHLIETIGDRLEHLLEAGVYFDEIVTKTHDEPQRVYDLVVPETKSFTTNGISSHNTSCLTRIIPWWAVEKALMNAMVTAARRRAGNILHITAGLDDRWEPTSDEMDDIANLFIQAEEDPVGAVVATRTGVDASEVRSGGDIWKWTDEWATFSEAKMRGLGISEGLLSGDATYNNAEQARSVFTEQILTLRQYLTQQVYYRRYKTLARAHGFRKRKKAELDHRVRIEKEKTKELRLSGEELSLKNLTQQEAFDIPEEDLIVPTMQWHKSLLPEGDREYLDLLSTLKEEGIPIPLKVWAARGGYDLTEAMEMLDEDVKLREKIKEWKKKTAGNGEEEEGAFSNSADRTGNNSPFWDASKRFLQLRKSDAARCLQRLVDTVHQPGKQEVLADTRQVMRICRDTLGSDRKAELMGYLLMRLGLVGKLPISAEIAHDISQFIQHKPGLSERRRTQELQQMVRLVAGDVDEVTASLADRSSDLRVLMERARTPALSLDSPRLLSGAA